METKYNICIEAKGSVRFTHYYFILMTESLRLRHKKGNNVYSDLAILDLIRELI